MGQGRDSGSDRRDEFVKRAAFALLASLALHDKQRRRRSRSSQGLPLIERAATDERNFVKKGVSWALRRSAGATRRSTPQRLPSRGGWRTSANPASRWIGKGAVRELTSPLVKRALARTQSTQRKQSTQRRQS